MGSLSVHLEVSNAAGLSYRWQYGERHALYAVLMLSCGEVPAVANELAALVLG
jgi:hypothetical protein